MTGQTTAGAHPASTLAAADPITSAADLRRQARRDRLALAGAPVSSHAPQRDPNLVEEFAAAGVHPEAARSKHQ